MEWVCKGVSAHPPTWILTRSIYFSEELGPRFFPNPTTETAHKSRQPPKVTNMRRTHRRNPDNRPTRVTKKLTSSHEASVVLDALVSPALRGLLLVLLLDLRRLAPDLASTGKGSVNLTCRCTISTAVKNNPNTTPAPPAQNQNNKTRKSGHQRTAKQQPTVEDREREERTPLASQDPLTQPKPYAPKIRRRSRNRTRKIEKSAAKPISRHA